MQKYIALLRGINVGGKNQLSMPELKNAFELAGFSDVTTYINSGNIIFSCEEQKAEDLIRQCETLIAKRFDMNIAVCIISAQALADAMKHAPIWWNASPESKHNAVFVIPPATAEDIVKEVGAIKPEYEQVAHYGQLVFWSAPLETFSKTRWSKIVGSSSYGKVTIRNANTATKLLSLSR